MNPVHWIFFSGTVVVSLGFALYGQWVLWKYRASAYGTNVTGCEIARFVLDKAGFVQVPVTPMEPSEEYLSAEGLFLESRVYEGRDFLSILHAARQAFLKSQLSNMTFWVRLKKRIAFVIRFTVLAGWILLVLGNLSPALRFLVNLGLGCFTVVMGLVIFDLPFEMEVEEKTARLLKQSGHFQPNEMVHLKKLGMAIALWGLAALVRAPFNKCLCILGKKGIDYGL
ncbi:MAG: zinc metallopeptidase [Candidatus Omnitrophica bacterium]|nr:zinc metallopeptidase [Candidatus Omnitrophota bacterium]